MSDNTLHIDPGQLQGQQPKFHSAGSSLQDIHDTLVANLDSLGEPWGSDKSGQEFAAKYKDARDNTLVAMHGTGGTVTGIGDACKNIAAKYADANDIKIEK